MNSFISEKKERRCVAPDEGRLLKPYCFVAVHKSNAIDFGSVSDLWNPSVGILRYECDNKIWHFYSYVIAVMSGISDSVTTLWTGLGPACRCDARGTNMGTRCSLQGKMMILDLACTWLRSLFRPFLSHWSVQPIHLKAFRRAKYTKVCSWALLDVMWIPWPEQMAWLRCPNDSFLIQQHT